ncbi:MAG: 2Fe-2S iron-sulfur cluster-binding protein [Alphaproteobacteria bacterium]
MPRVTFIDVAGNRREVDARSGETLVDVARRNDIAIEAACGGALSCSTCHVIVDLDDFERLPDQREDEQDMLDLAFGLTATSRLGCQITVSDELDGLTVTLPAGFSG